MYRTLREVFQLKVNDIPAGGMPFFCDSIVSAWDLCAYENARFARFDAVAIVSAWDLCTYENNLCITGPLTVIVSAWDPCAYEN